jgi:hypothetical protein
MCAFIVALLWQHGRVDLPGWTARWCRDHLGAEPVELLYRSRHMSEVLGLRLADGREVVVKSRPDQNGRAATCVEVQRILADQGFPCAAPLTGVTVHEGSAIHAERWRPGGEMLRGDDPATAALFATLLASLVSLAVDIDVGGSAPGAVAPPLPNPEWVRWEHGGTGPWPALHYFDARPPARSLPDEVDDAARRIRERMALSRLPRVLGHADWETQNLRWHGTTPWAVHDWDSLAWLPEAAIAGSACGAFASAEQPTLVPIASSAAFLDAYQAARRPFTGEEREVAWAASLWLPLHNARGEAIWDLPPVATTAVRIQAAERLRLAGA